MVSGGNEVVRKMGQRYRNADSSCQFSLLLLYKHPDATLQQFSENKHPNDYAAHECWGLHRHAINSTFKKTVALVLIREMPACAQWHDLIYNYLISASL